MCRDATDMLVMMHQREREREKERERESTNSLIIDKQERANLVVSTGCFLYVTGWM